MKKNKIIEKKEELDLYTLVYVHLSRELCEDAANRFKNDPSIALVKDDNPLMQRFIINRYFYNLLLTYRANGNTPVFNQLAMLNVDRNNEEWFKLFINFIAPFLKEHSVFQAVYCMKS